MPREVNQLIRSWTYLTIMFKRHGRIPCRRFNYPMRLFCKNDLSETRKFVFIIITLLLPSVVPKPNKLFLLVGVGPTDV